MCGIFGYQSNKPCDIGEMVIEGLKKLEYRGYDSWGITAKTANGLNVLKGMGKVGDVANVGNSNIAIGHTRWATCGKVTKENAHPHVDCSNKISVVHNGTIENYQELREELIKKGHKFLSHTDTEVIPHLIEEYGKGLDFVEAVKKSMSRVDGTYALLIVSKDYEGIIAVRNDSPLVIGVADDGYFIASDVLAFIEHTKKVIYLDDNEMATINGGLKIVNMIDNKIVEKAITKLSWDTEKTKIGEYKHYMLKEIDEQVETIGRAASQDKQKIDGISKKINDAYGVFFIACGSSYHAALCASYLFSYITKKHVNVILASEFGNYRDFLTDKTLVVAISQSGETADVLDAVKTAKKKGSKIVSIVNVMGSTLTRISDDFLLINAGPEICVLSTKTYTAQLSLLLLLAYSCVGRYDGGKKEIETIRRIVKVMLSNEVENKIKALAKKIKDKDHLYTIGRGINYPTALEAALKIKEVSYIHAEGFAGGELKHGTMALIEKGTPCIVFCDYSTLKDILNNAEEVKARGGYIIGISPQNNEVFDFFIEVPETENSGCITNIIPVQMLAYYLAVLRGCDPDMPRNLAKSVTVK